jgi:hypothetical protein
MPITVHNSYKADSIGCLQDNLPGASLKVVHRIPIDYTSRLEQRWYKTKTRATDDITRIHTYLGDQISVNEMMMGDGTAGKLRYLHNTVYVTGDVVERPKVPYIIRMQAGSKAYSPNTGTPNKAGNVEVTMPWLLTADWILYTFKIEDDPLDRTKYTAMYVKHPDDTQGNPINPIIGAISIAYGEKTGTFQTEGHLLARGDTIIRITATNRAGTTYYQVGFVHEISI